jgi:hypothetical protein
MVENIPRLFQAYVAPAIFISAAALLALSINVRLMGMVSRLREFHRERREAAATGRAAEAAVLGDQIISIEGRAELIRKAFLFTLLCLAGTVVACLFLGLGLYWNYAQVLAAIAISVAILSLLVGTIYYLVEVMAALGSVREESEFFRFPEVKVSAARKSKREEPEEGWQEQKD